MKTPLKSSLHPLAALAGALLLTLSASAAAPAAAGPLAGRWALTLPNGAAGWLEVADRGGWLDGAILWGGGSVLPAAHVHVHDGVLTLTRVRDVERKDAAGVGRPPAHTASRHGHGEHAAAIRGKQRSWFEVGTHRHQPVRVGSVG